jgi:tetratricopeptide (TPR) repeat protein
MKRRRWLSLILCLALFGWCRSGQAITPTWAELMTAGRNAHFQGRFDEAKVLLKAALKDAQSEKNEAMQAQTYLWLGRVYESTNQWDFAEQMLVKGNEIGIRTKALDAEILIALRHELENALHKQGKVDAIHTLRRSKGNKENQYIRAFKPSLLVRGREFFADKNYGKAEPALRKALEDYRDANDTEIPQVMICIDMLYQIYRDQKEWSKAEEVIDKVMVDLRRRRASGSDYSLKAANLLFYRSAIYDLQGRTKEAAAEADKGFAIYKNLKTDPHVIQILFAKWDITGKVKESARLREHYAKIAAGLPKVQKSGWVEYPEEELKKK